MSRTLPEGIDEVRHCVVQGGAERPDAIVLPVGMDPVGEENDRHLPLGVDPQGGAGEAEVAAGPPRQLGADRTDARSEGVPAEDVGPGLDRVGVNRGNGQRE